MKRSAVFGWVVLAAAIGFAGPALAAHGEAAVVYWVAETEFEAGAGGTFESAKDDSNGAGIRAEIWINRFGVSGEYYGPETEEQLGDTDIGYLALDLKYKVLPVTRNSFLALGLGYEDFDFDAVDTTGIRAVVDGRVGFLGMAYAYGKYAYLVEVDDLELAGVAIGENGDGHELDLGIGFEPLPVLSLWLGYRETSLSFDVPLAGGSFDADTTGVYAAVGLHF